MGAYTKLLYTCGLYHIMLYMLSVQLVYVRYTQIHTFVTLTHLGPPVQRWQAKVIRVNVVYYRVLELCDEPRVILHTLEVPTTPFPNKHLCSWAITCNMQKTRPNITWSNQCPPKHAMQKLFSFAPYQFARCSGQFKVTQASKHDTSTQQYG